MVSIYLEWISRKDVEKMLKRDRKKFSFPSEASPSFLSAGRVAQTADKDAISLPIPDNASNCRPLHEGRRSAFAAGVKELSRLAKAALIWRLLSRGRKGDH